MWKEGELHRERKGGGRTKMRGRVTLTKQKGIKQIALTKRK